MIDTFDNAILFIAINNLQVKILYIHVSATKMYISSKLPFLPTVQLFFMVGNTFQTVLAH